MYDDDYDEEENEIFSREGGLFQQIDTPDLSEIKRFRKIEGEEIKENGYEESLKKRFSFVKENEGSDKKMDYIYDDSASNADEELEDLVAEFLDEEEIDEDLKKAREKMPAKLVDGLKTAFKILNENKRYLDKKLLDAMQYIGKILTKYPYPGPSGKLPEKYPYPGKPGEYPYPLKKNEPIMWDDMLRQMFGDSEDEDDDFFEKADEKPTKTKPWPSFDKEIKKQARKVEKAMDQMEQNTFNPYERID